VFEKRYALSAKLAEEGGMDAVMAHDGWAADWQHMVAVSAGSMAHLSAIPPSLFADTM